ncbi:hypothetical protein [Rubritalea profundi]|uniref:Uncharacterized protein n=1 Tax=Rubritalea profundi TaxID=1658618 RepID=A0A2S7U1T4_9BACT|nr:hypothetical protein [Rubritalea profundi]PQJ28133.1 hypothetical protein BSZ32_06205 [Rubritalea profundi]
MELLNKVVTDPKYYKRLLPIYGKKIQENRRASPLAPLRGLTGQLKKAKPEVQKLGAEVLGIAYGNFPAGYHAPGGSDMHGGADYFQRVLNSTLSDTPGGMDVLKTIPKRTSAWQKSRKNADLYSYDGKVKDNKKRHGKWTVIDYVQTTKEFKSDKKMNPGKPPFKEVVLQAGGKTSNPSLIWTGQNLIDLGRNQMLLMEGVSLSGKTYLFIEAGGFTTGKPNDWHPGWYVLKQVK